MLPLSRVQSLTVNFLIRRGVDDDCMLTLSSLLSIGVAPAEIPSLLMCFAYALG
jgi:hypothetical protein